MVYSPAHAKGQWADGTSAAQAQRGMRVLISRSSRWAGLAQFGRITTVRLAHALVKLEDVSPTNLTIRAHIPWGDLTPVDEEDPS